MSFNFFTDILAFQLSQDAEIYAIRLPDAAVQFVDITASNLFRGEGLICTHTTMLIFATARTGFLRNKVSWNLFYL